MLAVGLATALLAFYVLQLGAALLSWYDSEIRTPGQSDAIAAYSVCSLLLVPVYLFRGRWRVVPLLAATAAGVATPVLLSRDLLGMLGVPDVWIGQSLTLHVLFPLVVGLVAATAVLVRGSRRS